MNKSISQNIPIISSLLLFCILFGLGQQLSSKRYLWNDEIYTQVYGIEKLTYKEILAGKSDEGNNFPLFYILQKLTTDIYGFKLDFNWEGEWNIEHAKAQAILRIISNLSMSAAITLFFFFFVRQKKWLVGFFALAACLSSFMVWSYWVEARPYSLWFLLTSAQMLLTICYLSDSGENKVAIRWLTFINILLCLTILFGAIQTVFVVAMIYLFKTRKWNRFLTYSLLPLFCSVFYYFKAPKYGFWFFKTPSQLILECVNPSLLILSLLGVLFIIFTLFKREKLDQLFKYSGLIFLLFFALAITLLIYLKVGSTTPDKGFAIANRYFFFLTPISIVTISLFYEKIFDYFRNDKLINITVHVIFWGLVILQILKTYINIFAIAIY